MIALLLGWLTWAEPAGGEPPACAMDQLRSLTLPPERLAVAWVGRWGREPRGALRVVAAADLGAWIASQNPAWTGRTLQRLGERRRNTDPKRRWKVVIYEVERTALCRPVSDTTADVAGVPACPSGWSRASEAQDGCGSTVDRRTGEAGFVAYYVRAKEAGETGMCQIPLTRYVQEAGRRLAAPRRK